MRVFKWAGSAQDDWLAGRQASPRQTIELTAGMGLTRQRRTTTFAFGLSDD